MHLKMSSGKLECRPLCLSSNVLNVAEEHIMTSQYPLDQNRGFLPILKAQTVTQNIIKKYLQNYSFLKQFTAFK